MTAALCLLVRNEQPDLAEWILHHLGIGFTAIFVYDNNSDDGTTDLLDHLAKTLPVLRIAWPYPPGPRMQLACYEHALANLRGAADWVAFLDADEFLIGPAGQSIGQLLSNLTEHSYIAMNWLIFGSSGLAHSDGRLVLEAFTRRAPLDFGPNGHVKSIVRPERMDGCINPHLFASEAPVVDVSGCPITDWAHVGVTTRARIVQGPWRLHHYFTRSAAHWQRRLLRGSADTTLTRRGDQDFTDYDRNEVPDDRALAYVPRLRTQLAALGFRA